MNDKQPHQQDSGVDRDISPRGKPLIVLQVGSADGDDVLRRKMLPLWPTKKAELARAHEQAT